MVRFPIQVPTGHYNKKYVSAMLSEEQSNYFQRLETSGTCKSVFNIAKTSIGVSSSSMGNLSETSLWDMMFIQEESSLNTMLSQSSDESM